MRAVAVNPQRKLVDMIDRPQPEVSAPTDVLLRIVEVGICGTDREIAGFHYGTPARGEDWLVLGHESLAEVVEVGPAVDDLAAGELVVAMVRRPCEQASCLPCRSGRQDYCRTGEFRERGIKELDGFLTEYVVEDRQWLHQVPQQLRDVAVLIEPLTIAQKALAQVWDVQRRLPWGRTSESGEGLSAVVLGAGPVGLLGAMALVNAGFTTTLYTRSPAPNPKADLAAQIGAGYVSSLETTPAELARQVGPIDLCYEAAGVSHAAFDLLSALATNGVYVLTGVPRDEPPALLDSDDLMRGIVLGNQAVLGTVNAGAEDFTAAIADLDAFMQRWPETVRGLITGRHPLESFEGLLTGRSQGIKDVVVLSS
jgi:threonine dehydrogenase-like Zn-dependent dehydrogenase